MAAKLPEPARRQDRRLTIEAWACRDTRVVLDGEREDSDRRNGNTSKCPISTPEALSPAPAQRVAAPFMRNHKGARRRSSLRGTLEMRGSHESWCCPRGAAAPPYSVAGKVDGWISSCATGSTS